jgi:hypothetical protein
MQTRRGYVPDKLPRGDDKTELQFLSLRLANINDIIVKYDMHS